MRFGVLLMILWLNGLFSEMEMGEWVYINGLSGFLVDFVRCTLLLHENFWKI